MEISGNYLFVRSK